MPSDKSGTNITIRPIEYIRSVLSMLVFFLIFIVGAILITILVLLTFGKATNWIIQYLGPLLAYPVLKTAGISLKVRNHGFEYDRPVVYIINHSSTLDLFTMVALGMPKIRFVAKWEIQYFPFFFIIGRLTGQVFIKRKNRAQAVEALQKTYSRLKRDELSIMIAPEGSRKHEGIIGPFKKGAFRTAIDLQYDIVPIFFEGSYELSAGGSSYTKTGTVTAHIHKPVSTKDWSLESLEEHIAEVRGMYLEWAGVEETTSE